MFTLTSNPLESLNLRDGFVRSDAGALCVFEGWVRDSNDGKTVVGLEYEAFEKLCETEGKKILAEAHRQFQIMDARCFHRTGKLTISEMAVWVGVTAAHREPAFAASRYIIDQIKHRLPIWKKEYYADGESAWVNCAEVGELHAA